MIIHHNEAISSLERCFRRADLDAGRVVAVVAQDKGGPCLGLHRRELMYVLRKYLFKGAGPYPLYLVFWIVEMRHIVDVVTRVNAVPASWFCEACFQVHDHSPFGLDVPGLFCQGFSGNEIKSRPDLEACHRKICYLEKVPTVHMFESIGL